MKIYFIQKRSAGYHRYISIDTERKVFDRSAHIFRNYISISYREYLNLLSELKENGFQEVNAA